MLIKFLTERIVGACCRLLPSQSASSGDEADDSKTRVLPRTVSAARMMHHGIDWAECFGGAYRAILSLVELVHDGGVNKQTQSSICTGSSHGPFINHNSR